MFMYKKEITVIELEDGFIIEIGINENYETRDFYIYHEDYEIKMLMFGLGTEYTDFIEILDKETYKYIEIYKKEFMDQEFEKVID